MARLRGHIILFVKRPDPQPCHNCGGPLYTRPAATFQQGHVCCIGVAHVTNAIASCATPSPIAPFKARSAVWWRHTQRQTHGLGSCNRTMACRYCSLPDKFQVHTEVCGGTLLRLQATRCTPPVKSKGALRHPGVYQDTRDSNASGSHRQITCQLHAAPIMESNWAHHLICRF